MEYSTRIIRSKVTEECITRNCPHITSEGECPFWGNLDEGSYITPVDALWKRGGCCFYKWSKEDARKTL